MALPPHGRRRAGGCSPSNELQAKPEIAAARKQKRKGKQATVTASPVVPERISYGPNHLVFLLVGYGVSGFAALVYEIAWTRALSLLIGSSVYAFSMILTAFVLGIALGSVVYARFVDRVRDPLRTLAVIQAAIGLSALPVIPFIGNLPFLVTGLISLFGTSFWKLQAVEFVMIVIIMLLPTALMGAAFPLASRLFVRTSAPVGKSVGTLYASNTIGNILGSFAGGFILIPLAGIENTLFIAVLINVAVGGLFFALSRTLSVTGKGLAAGAVMAVAVGGILLTPPWSAAEMSFGPFYEALRQSKSVARSPAELRRSRPNASSFFTRKMQAPPSRSNICPGGSLSLYSNGKPDASSHGDLPSQELVAHIPSADASRSQERPRYRSGQRWHYPRILSQTWSGLIAWRSPPPWSRPSRFFDDYNYRILDDPRVNLIIAHGRNHLALTDKKYDVIISEPSNPFIAGVADLFTREYFRSCRDRLTHRGAVAAWMQAYLIDKESFRSIVRTFQSVFPEMTLWKTAKGDCIMVGSKVPLRVDYQSLRVRIQQKAVAGDLSRIDVHNAAGFPVPSGHGEEQRDPVYRRRRRSIPMTTPWWNLPPRGG